MATADVIAAIASDHRLDPVVAEMAVDIATSGPAMVEQIAFKVRAQAATNDEEAATATESSLHAATLIVIAAGGDNPVELARMAALTQGYAFSRY